MKREIKSLLASSIALTSFSLFATVYVYPPGNIATNSWGGNYGGYDNNPNAPGNSFISASDIYQDLSTSPGQQYKLDFYAAADLYFGPSLTLEVALNSQPLVSISTPPYTYNSGVNRNDQMRWQEYTYSFIGSASTTRLEFIDQNTYDFGLAAVSVVQVPEPPTTWLMLMAGVVAIYCLQRQRQAQPNNSPEPPPIGAVNPPSRLTVSAARLSFCR